MGPVASTLPIILQKHQPLSNKIASVAHAHASPVCRTKNVIELQIEKATFQQLDR